ncbi:hypothetical protein [Legionella cincinnatiensis]|uniref:Transmembrane protein n=1 Tax=Legionella cincinnatiensis TaxID=28085 RepID=A0A378IIL9_9GAMM|nr:hypothetical protein [Legionella cincinnatiensis]KTC91742.1 hypothetical protein Lcin_1142 [Legionella cincinnatiensis]STX34555.1 Uncharacterised protein [Legionella cincinnatiensis]
MSLESSVEKGIADFSLIIGKGLMYGGGAGLLIMAVVGTIAIDLVLLAYAEKHHNDFMTGWILGTMFWGPRVDPLPLLIASPITSLIAVGLSLALGVPQVGVALLTGWALAATVFTVGCALVSLSESINLEPEHDQIRRLACV